MIFVENIIMNLIIDNDFKEKNQIINLFNPEFLMLEFHVIIIKLLKFEMFKFMQKFYMKLEQNLQIL